MFLARCLHASSRSEFACCRVIDLRRRRQLRVWIAPGNGASGYQDAAIAELADGKGNAGHAHAARALEFSCRRVIKLRTRKALRVATGGAAYQQHFAIGQQNGFSVAPGGDKTAGDLEPLRGWI